jgi:D-alanyl-D-alanine dipeptidase
MKPDDPRLLNRRLLHRAMTEEGFLNYPLEFWHYDFGDQMYVLHAGLLKLPDAPKTAWYGYADAPHDA